MGKTDCFTQFYPILPNWFYPLGKTTMPTLMGQKWGKGREGRRDGSVRTMEAEISQGPAGAPKGTAKCVTEIFWGQK